MYNILNKYKAKKITAEQAFKEIENELLTANNKERQVLMDISEQILNLEVPLEDRDKEAEKVFWSSTKHGEEFE
jgi:hypothetical protein